MGIVVKFLPDDDLKAEFKKNFDGCRKIYNEVLGRYHDQYGEKYTQTLWSQPTRNDLEKYLKEYYYRFKCITQYSIIVP